MPLTALVRQLQQAALTGEVLARLARAERLRVALAEEKLARLAKAKESREKMRSAKVGWC